MQRRQFCLVLCAATLFVVGCRGESVEQPTASAQPIKAIAETSTDLQLRNVNFPMPGHDGGPVLPGLPALDENGQPELPPLPEVPSHKDAPQLPTPPQVPGVPDVNGKIQLPALPQLPELPRPESAPAEKLPTAPDIVPSASTEASPS